MSQFWQKKQPMLQPAVPIEKIRVPGQKMVQRFFLDGINLHRGRMRVAQAVEFAALVRANEAEPRLPFPDVAMPRAKITVRLAAGFGFPPAGFMQLRGFLEDLQARHRIHP